MLNYNLEYGFIYDYTDINTLKQNLNSMKAKLEGFLLFQDDKILTQITPNVINTINNNVSNQISISVAIEEAKDRVEDLTALSKDQIDDINEKLDELKTIVESDEKAVSKWDKAKPIFKYIIDKGLDVAKIVVPLIGSM